MDDDCIFLEQMVFFGYHGAYAAERELGQRFVVDLALGVDLYPAGKSDQLDDTVNYVRVYDVVRGVVEGPPCNLLETVAQRIAEAVLAEERIQWCRVRLAKPGVAIRGALAGVAVQITRRR
ncbi:MAG TPA: dihydroneopterin aldolase [Chloroflexota bacterium]|jgi:dihydroneopterin aldolase|nr:dihydroneopterin aldolase [Chloroflexota bacterium]